MKKIVFMFALLAMVGITQAADTITSLDGSQDWSSDLKLTNSYQDITSDQSRNGNGSLMQSTTSGAGKAVAYFDTGSSLGTLSEFASGIVNFDFYRDSSSTAQEHLAPAFELGVDADGDGTKDCSLKWEATYNGYGSITEDSWYITDNIADEYWWMWNGAVIKDFDVTLSDWANGHKFDSSTLLDGSASILWCNVSIGSGWADTYLGYVDNVSLEIGGNTYVSNFETTAAVPAPGALLLTGIGTACVGRIRRRVI